MRKPRLFIRMLSEKKVGFDTLDGAAETLVTLRVVVLQPDLYRTDHVRRDYRDNLQVRLTWSSMVSTKLRFFSSLEWWRSSLTDLRTEETETRQRETFPSAGHKKNWSQMHPLLLISVGLCVRWSPKIGDEAKGRSTVANQRRVACTFAEGSEKTGCSCWPSSPWKSKWILVVLKMASSTRASVERLPFVLLVFVHGFKGDIFVVHLLDNIIDVLRCRQLYDL
jgi:hypothetical protein